MSSEGQTTQGAEPQPKEPREGGWGIVVVIAAHLSLAIQVGLVRSGGVLYLSWKEDFDTNDKDTATIQSVSSSVVCFSGLFAGIVTHRFGCRLSGILTGVTSFLGYFGSYWVTDIYQFYVTIFLTGVGMGFCQSSAVVVVALYFKRKYILAHAVAYGGIGTGIIAAPPLVQTLLEAYGWRGAYLICSAISANSIALGAFFRPNRAAKCDKQSRTEDDGLELESTLGTTGETTDSGQTGLDVPQLKSSNSVVKGLKILSVTLGVELFLKSYRFTLQNAIHLEYTMAYVGFLLYIVPRAQSLGVAPSSAAILLSIFGIGSLVGRLATGLLASWKISAEQLTTLSLFLAGVSTMLLSSESYLVFAIASFVHGFASGVFFAILAVLFRKFVGVRKLATGFGVSQLLAGIGALSGPILSGWILDQTGGNYPTVFYVLGALCFFCAVQMLLLPLLKRVEPGLDITPTDA